MHITEDAGRRTFAELKAERPTTSAFSLTAAQPQNLDPESAAKRILEHALASDTMPSLTAPKVDGDESTFKSLGVETVPLTGTKVVKFRQQVKGIPVYGSLISVELGDNNEMVSLNSNIAKPDVASYVARISPQEALKKVAGEAGYGRQLPDSTPKLNLYLDAKGKWHLAYMIEDVRSLQKTQTAGDSPLVYDYVIDALSGSTVAELPRTPTATETANDEQGNPQTFSIDMDGGKKVMRDPTLNIETFDFRFADPQVQASRLPGNLVAAPFSPAAVSAHVNATRVATFLRDVLKRNNIDNVGGRMVSSVNCLLKRDERPPGSKIWLNAFWDGQAVQMIYGQAKLNGRLQSLSASLSVVAHELFHGVTGATSRLVYQDESGALNESYSDIFGIIVANFNEPDISNWDFLIGDGLSTGLEALRDMRDPTRFNQPKLMSDFVDTSADHGGVHTNSGIHNFAAFNVITAQSNGAFLFKAEELAAMFYIALTQQLSSQSTFAASHRAVALAARSLFRNLPQGDIDTRIGAIDAGFAAAGIA
ncbi:MAG TPA: M4 family metallopeptidase [Bradyrhizobium sp.]|nr:M4 family metallopeptidase [Bradyrhizobium sp.]